MYSLIDTHSRDNKKHFRSVIIMVCCARPQGPRSYAWPAKPAGRNKKSARVQLWFGPNESG